MAKLNIATGQEGSEEADDFAKTFSDYVDFMCGDADFETRQRIAAMLEDENSLLSQMSNYVGRSSKAMTGWEYEDGSCSESDNE